MRRRENSLSGSLRTWRRGSEQDLDEEKRRENSLPGSLRTWRKGSEQD